MWWKVETPEFWDGEVRGLTVAGRPVLLVKLDGVVNAFEDRCPHQGQALSRGKLVGCVLTCAAHGWQFDVATGHGVNPRAAALKAIPARITEGEVWLDVDHA